MLVTLASILIVLLSTAVCSGSGSASTPRQTNAFYATKTPYSPQQQLSSYESPPPGYEAVFTQMVARHGSRAATSAKDIGYIKQLIGYAVAGDALTEHGAQLLPQVSSLEAANVALGYGNLSGLGVIEHQELAARLLTRLPDLFHNAVSTGRRIVIVNSGKDRAVDSSKEFAASLAAHMEALAPFIDAPVSNLNLLYFFAENEKYQDWLANDPTLSAKLDQIFYSERSHREARQMLRRSFKAKFIDRLASGDFSFTDPKGKSFVLNEVDLASSLYNLYQIAPGLREEGTWHFDEFVPASAAQWFAYLSDSSQFYQKGPSFAGGTITFAMAKVLQDDFFNAVGVNCNPSSPIVAYLRFAHAETVIPLAALMQLPYSDQQVPVAETYTYKDNPWRGRLVSPYAVNIQWDSFSNESGACLVRMLYNEKQMRLKPSCKSIRPKSFYYGFGELKRCYGY